MVGSFVDTDWKKITVMSMMGALLISFIAIFAFANYRWSFIDQSANFINRSVNEALYAFSYKVVHRSVIYYEKSSSGSQGQARAVPVLIYHGTPPEGRDNPPLPQEVFVEQMRALKADGWQTATMDQFKAFMKDGAPLPAKTFLLTFDDARKESFYPVDPVLKELDYHAIMFVITGFSMPAKKTRDSTFYLSASELQYMAQSGRWDLESHGDQDHRLYDVPSSQSAIGVGTIPLQHFLSNKFWLAGPGHIESDDEYRSRIEDDLVKSKNALAELSGTPVIAFAFPFSDYGQEGGNYKNARDVLADVVHTNFTFAFYQVGERMEDIYNYPDPNEYMIKRVEPLASWSGAYLVGLLDSDAPKDVGYTSTSFGQEWISNWGDVSSEGNGLSLKATSKTTGAVTLLAGSRLWKDYSIETTFDWQRGSDVSLIARYLTDSTPFITCAFSKGKILLQAREKGRATTIASAEYSAPDMSDVTVAMSVQGTSADCSAAGAHASAHVGPDFTHNGQTGVQIWDENPDVAHIVIKKVVIRAL